MAKQILGLFLILIGLLTVAGTYYNIKYFNSAAQILTDHSSLSEARITYGITILVFAIICFFSFKKGFSLIRNKNSNSNRNEPLDKF